MVITSYCGCFGSMLSAKEYTNQNLHKQSYIGTGNKSVKCCGIKWSCEILCHDEGKYNNHCTWALEKTLEHEYPDSHNTHLVGDNKHMPPEILGFVPSQADSSDVGIMQRCRRTVCTESRTLQQTMACSRGISLIHCKILIKL